VKLLRKGVPSFSLLALHWISGKERKPKLENSYNHLFTSMFILAITNIMVKLISQFLESSYIFVHLLTARWLDSNCIRSRLGARFYIFTAWKRIYLCYLTSIYEEFHCSCSFFYRILFVFYFILNNMYYWILKSRIWKYFTGELFITEAVPEISLSEISGEMLVGINTSFPWKDFYRQGKVVK